MSEPRSRETLDERIRTLSIRHRVALGRYSNHLVRRVVAQVRRVEVEVMARLGQAAPDTLGANRMESLIEELRAIHRAGWDIIGGDLTSDLGLLGLSEAQFARQIGAAAAEVSISTFAPAPTLPQVIAAVQARPFQGKFLREWLSEAGENAARRTRETIRQGVIEGKTTSQMVRDLRGTAKNGFKDGILQISRRGAEAMVRTAVTHTSSVGHQIVYDQNADVIKGIEWVSTLDTRTTDICIARDGKVYPVNKGPRPPAHIACRSTTVPVVRQIEGVVPFTRQTYPEWLRAQPVEVQNEVLGVSRAKLFRAGKFKVDAFVDGKGRRLTLEELRQKDAKAFAEVGL